MPYNIGSKGSNGCSGFPVMTDTGKVVGCHPTKAEATNHLQALYAKLIAKAVLPIAGRPAMITRSEFWKPDNLLSKSIKPVEIPVI